MVISERKSSKKVSPEDNMIRAMILNEIRSRINSNASQQVTSQDGQAPERGTSRAPILRRTESVNNKNSQSRHISVSCTGEIDLSPGSGISSISQPSTSRVGQVSRPDRFRVLERSRSLSLPSRGRRSQVSDNNEVPSHLASQPNGSRSISNSSFSTERASTQGISPRGTSINAYQYDPMTFDPSQLTLKQACNVMGTFDIDIHYRLIERTLCKFSVRIYGLEDCHSRDLRIAVFFFIEKYFGIKPAIELCVKHIPDEDDPNVVGVIFEESCTSQLILRSARVLVNTNYRVLPNIDAAWIVRNYDCD